MADTEQKPVETLTVKFFRGYWKALTIAFIASIGIVFLSPVFALEAKIVYTIFRFIFNLW